MKLEKILLFSEIIIGNALSDTGILDALTIYGYPKPRIMEGRRMLDDLRELVYDQKVAKATKIEATAKLNEAFTEAKTAFYKTIKVARVAYHNDVQAQSALMLKGRRKTSYSGWLLQAESFYNNAVEVSGEAGGIFDYGYTREKLEGEKKLAQKVRQSHEVRETMTGRARQALRLRDAKRAELEKWLKDFKVIARVALSGSPGLLKKLGL